MDRFEEDLAYTKLKSVFYLHSSMDRFEVKVTSTTFCTSAIYIPVWIDLKISRQKRLQRSFLIYIPVWIDLKNQIIIISDDYHGFTFQYG